MTTTVTGGSAPAVNFVASGDLIAALDLAAGQIGTTRSHYVRTVVARHLRDTGLLAVGAPVTHHDAKRQAGR